MASFARARSATARRPTSTTFTTKTCTRIQMPCPRRKIHTRIRRLPMPSSQFDRRRALLVPLAASLVLLGGRPGFAAPSAEAAQSLIEQVSAEVLGILSDQGLSDRQKFDALVEVLSQPIDLDLVARL